MVSLGNSAVNSIYEARLDAAKDLTKPQPDSPQPVRDSWIQAKYVKKLFVDHSWNGADELDQETPIFSESGKFRYCFTPLYHILLIILLRHAGQVDPNWLLSKGAEAGRISWISRALALYADRNTTTGNPQERTPVHLAILSVNLLKKYNDSVFRHKHSIRFFLF